MKHSRKFAVVALAAVAVGGCSAYASGADDRIEAAAKESYVFRTYLKNDSVKVDADAGVVTLSGAVAADSHKALAAGTVENLPGVISVKNEIKVEGEPSTEGSDAWISAKVKTSLLFNADVSGLDTQVETKDGVVMLRGEADTEAQKELTTEYAKDIEGVKEVRNEIRVKAPAADEGIERAAKRAEAQGEAVVAKIGDRIDDASVTAQVKMALFTHRSTSALNTEVKTRDGVVTLTGTAKNDAEKALVSKLVKDIHGVSSVSNNMNVERGA
ncbi:MAG: BON domain-containing protein [Candidatus Methylomirabilis sp.]|nr:BON domain-containing protein [Deltaproteobacteria bacterium]